MTENFGLLVVEPNESLGDVLGLFLENVPHWDIVATANSGDSALQIAKTMGQGRKPRIDAAILECTLEGHRSQEGMLLDSNARVAKAVEVARGLQLAIPKLELVGFGPDADYMEKLLDKDSLALYKNIECNFSLLPTILGDLAVKLEKQAA